MSGMKFKIPKAKAASHPAARHWRKGFAIAIINLPGSLVYLHPAESWVATSDDFYVWLECEGVRELVTRLRREYQGCETKFGRFNMFDMEFTELRF